jgi:rhodanese-related sulfurtransferase
MFNFREMSTEELTPQQAEQKLKGGQTLLIDVRESYEFSQIHIDGAKLVPLGDLPRRIKEVASPEQELIVMCRSGSRSSYALQQLKSMGYKKVYNLNGGIISWAMSGLPVLR